MNVFSNTVAILFFDELIRMLDLSALIRPIAAL
jgi:hypothetical protein